MNKNFQMASVYGSMESHKHNSGGKDERVSTDLLDDPFIKK
jgi:hypothetical protein